MKNLFLIFLILYSKNIFANSEMISIRSFGAVGNGISDDSKAFQSAFDYCKSHPYTTLKIPRGKYLITHQLLVRNAINIIGENNAELIVDNEVPHNLLYFYEKAADVKLENIIFNSVKNTKTPELLRFERGKNIVVSGCTFLGIRPMAFSNSNNIKFINNVLQSNSIIPSGYCNFIKSSNIFISGNLFKSAGGVQFVNACSYIKIVDNQFYNMRNYPIHFDGHASIKHKYVLITKNKLIGSGAIAYKGGTYDQISCFNVERIQIINNTISKSGDMGITLANCRDVYIYNNLITKSNVSAISLGTTYNCIIENNTMKDNGIRPLATGIDPRARAGVYIYANRSYSSDSILLKGNIISFTGNKWKYLPISVTSPKNIVHRFYLYSSQNYPLTGGYTNIQIAKQSFDIWRKDLFSRVKF